MKIAIITQPLRTNYGGILQNYALQTVLKRKGHDVTTLQANPQKKCKYPRYILTLLKRIILSLCGLYKNKILFERGYNQDYKVFTKYTSEFVNSNINCLILDDFKKQLSEYDYEMYIVGSDQVWRPAYNDLSKTFLSFTRTWNVIRCSYAASFGSDENEFSDTQLRECREMIKLFKSISVREDSGTKLVKQYFNRDATHVLDPTLLLDVHTYEKLIGEDLDRDLSGGLFCHILDKTLDKTKAIESLSLRKRLQPYFVNSISDENNLLVPISKRIQPPVEKWLDAIRNASFVITDSFHAMVFSIIFNKDFIVYANEERGCSRFVSLLSLLGIENRLIFNSNQLTDYDFAPVNYLKVNERLRELKIHSESFIDSFFE